MSAYGRIEGMGKALFQTGKKFGELFVDVGQEVTGLDDEFEGDNILDAIWGSWKDNVLGEQGMVNTLFGKDTRAPGTDPNRAYGGGFGGLLFGAIPEEIRKPANTIITPTFDVLDAVYEHVIDRPLGTMITIGMNGVIDPTDWIKAYNITNSRSMGQAFALAFTNVDWTQKNVEEQYAGTPWFNLLSGFIDATGNIWLDPANLLAPARLRQFSAIAKRTVHSTDYLAQADMSSRKYLRWKQQVQNVGQLEEFQAGLSDRYKNGLGYEPNSSDFEGINLIAQRLYTEFSEGRFGPEVKNLEYGHVRQLASVINNNEAFDLIMRMWRGDSTVLPEMMEKAQELMAQTEKGGLIDEINKIRQPARGPRLLGADGFPMDPIQRDIDLRNIQKQEMLLVGPDGKPLSKANPMAEGSTTYIADWEQSVTDLWSEAFGAVWDNKTIGDMPLAARDALVQTAERTGIWWSPRTAERIDPLGNGAYRWIPALSGRTAKTFIRRVWDDLSPEDQTGLLEWAGVHPNDTVGKAEFVDTWDSLVAMDQQMDDAVSFLRNESRNQYGGTVTPRTGEGLDAAQRQLAENRMQAQLAAEAHEFVISQGVGRKPAKKAYDEALELLSQDQRAAIIQAMEGALRWSARFGKRIDLHHPSGLTLEGFTSQVLRKSPHAGSNRPAARMDFGSKQWTEEPYFDSVLYDKSGKPIETDYSKLTKDEIEKLRETQLNPSQVAQYWNYLGATRIKNVKPPKGLFKTVFDEETGRRVTTDKMTAANRRIYEQVTSGSVSQRRYILEQVVGPRFKKWIGTPVEDIPPEAWKMILNAFEDAHFRKKDIKDPVGINLPVKGKKIQMYEPRLKDNQNLPYWGRRRWQLTKEMGPDDPFDPWWMGFILDIESTRSGRNKAFRNSFWEDHFGIDMFADKGVGQLPIGIREAVTTRRSWKDLSKAEKKAIRTARQDVAPVTGRQRHPVTGRFISNKEAQTLRTKEFGTEWDKYIDFEKDWDVVLRAADEAGKITGEGARLVDDITSGVNTGQVSNDGMKARDAVSTDKMNVVQAMKDGIRAGLLIKRQSEAGRFRPDIPDQDAIAMKGSVESEMMGIETMIGQRAEVLTAMRRDLRRREGSKPDPVTGTPTTKGEYIMGPKETRWTKVETKVLRHLDMETGEITRRTFHVRKWADSDRREVVIDPYQGVDSTPQKFAEAAQWEDYKANTWIGGPETEYIPANQFEDWAKANGWQIEESHKWLDENTGKIMTDEEMSVAMRTQSKFYRKLSPNEKAHIDEVRRREARRGLKVHEMQDPELKAIQDQIFGQLMEGEYVGFPYAAALSLEELRLRGLALRQDISVGRAEKHLEAFDDAINRDPALVMAAAEEIMQQYTPGILSQTPKLGSRQVMMWEFADTLTANKLFPTRVVRLFAEKVPQGIIYWDNVQHAFDQFDRMLRDAERVKNEWKLTNKGQSKSHKTDLTPDTEISLTEYSGVSRDEVMSRFLAADNIAAKQQIYHETVEVLTNGLVQLFEGRIQHWGKGGAISGHSPADLPAVLRRQHRSAEKELQNMGRRGKIYGNNQLVTSRAEAGHSITLRSFEAITPSQLATANLVPRFDLYTQAFTDLNPLQKSARNVKSAVGYTANMFTGVWKKGVLLRPAWPMRVLTDEIARNAAEIGTLNALRGVIHGWGNLQAGWYKQKGKDVGKFIRPAIIDDLNATGTKTKLGFDPENSSFPELVEAISTKYGTDQTVLQKLVKDSIVEQYRKTGLMPFGRTLSRAMGASAIGAWFGGPAGAAMAGGIHVLHSRRALKRLAELETARTMGYTLSNMATSRARSRIAEIEGIIVRKGLSPSGKQVDSWYREGSVDEYNALIKEAKTLHNAKDILETQGSNILEEWALGNPHARRQLKREDEARRAVEVADIYDEMALYEHDDIAENFDMVGKIMNDAGVGDYHLGGVRIGNEYGNTPQAVGIWKQAMSADQYGKNLWATSSQAQRSQVRAYDHTQYAYESGEPFVMAWNDTVNRQWAPMNDIEAYAKPVNFPDNPLNEMAERRADAKWYREQSGIPPIEGNPYQDFTRMFWLEDVTDDDIVRWLLHGPGRKLQESMPTHFARDEHSVRDWVKQARYETDSIVPNLPEFRLVRRQLSHGEEVSWERDMQPIIDKEFEGNIQGVRVAAANAGFNSADDIGKIIGDGSFQEAYATAGISTRVKRYLDQMFTHIGTMPTDELTRSVIFKTVYQREAAQRVQALAINVDTGTYVVTQKRLNAIEAESRRIALKETKNLLYDLAERTRFEEIMSNVMPFFAAYQEVITRWAGIATRNPEFMLTMGRNFRKALQGDVWPGDGILQQTDAEGNPVLDENGDPIPILDSEGNEQSVGLFRIPQTMFIDAKIPDWMPVFGGDDLFGDFSVLGDQTVGVNLSSIAMLTGGAPGFGPLIGWSATETRLAAPDVDAVLEAFFPFGIAEGDSYLARLSSSLLPSQINAAKSVLFSTNEKQRVLGRIAVDVIAEWELNGDTWDSYEAFQGWNEEVSKRAEALLMVRMFTRFALPLTVITQSPYAETLIEYNKYLKDYGVEYADEWLIREQSHLWGQLGRQTRVEGVAAATLEGHHLYEENKKFIDEHLSIKDFLTGKNGTLDVQFQFNNAVYRQEIADGRRIYQTPEEKWRRAQESIGWYKYNTYLAPINIQLDKQRALGLPFSLNAKYNRHLFEKKLIIVQMVAEKYPGWYEEYLDVKSASGIAEIVGDFRDYIQSDIANFHGRPELPHLVQYLWDRDQVAMELYKKAVNSGNPDMETLGHPANSELREYWTGLRVMYAMIPDFQEVYTRYFEGDETIGRNSWPQGLRMLKNRRLIEQQSEVA